MAVSVSALLVVDVPVLPGDWRARFLGGARLGAGPTAAAATVVRHTVLAETRNTRMSSVTQGQDIQPKNSRGTFEMRNAMTAGSLHVKSHKIVPDPLRSS